MPNLIMRNLKFERFHYSLGPWVSLKWNEDRIILPLLMQSCGLWPPEIECNEQNPAEKLSGNTKSF